MYVMCNDICVCNINIWRLVCAVMYNVCVCVCVCVCTQCVSVYVCVKLLCVYV
jgi:hypothetical protein